MINGLWRDLRYAARTLTPRRTFAVAAVSSIALAVGANSAIFAAVNGRRFGIGDAREPDTRQWRTVVGIVGDVKRTGLTEDAVSQMYFAGAIPDMTLVVKSTLDPARLAAQVRGIVRSVDPSQPISEIRLLDQIVSDSIAPQRVTMLLAAGISLLAIALVGTGIYGVISHSVARRTREIGVRIALGADGAEVLRLVVGQAMIPVLAGIALGLAGALASTRLLASLLFQVSPRDPATLLLVSTALVAVAFLASFLPARRAARLDPMAAIRE